MEAPWMKLGGKISKKRTKIIWAENAWGTRFTQLRGKRSTKESAVELACRAKFRQTKTQVEAIMQDVDQLEAYRQAWRAAVNAGNRKYHTLRGYVFAQVYSTL